MSFALARFLLPTTTSTRSSSSLLLKIATSTTSSSNTHYSLFSTQQKNKKGNSTIPGAYWSAKQQSKERRRELFESKLERKERLKTRRAGRPRTFLRQQFRSFFIPKKVNDEVLHRKAKQQNSEWEYHVSTILERIPIVLPDLQEWEQEQEDLMDVLAPYAGKEYPKELRQPTKYTRVSNEELLEALPFTPAPRETTADATGDVKTIHRLLKTRLYLLVRQNNTWQFPTVPLNMKEDDTLLKAAKRALEVHVMGSNSSETPAFDYWCPSNAPWSVDMQAFTPEQQQKTGLYGRKTFFVKVQLDEVLQGESGVDTKLVQDFGWLERPEIVQRIQQEQGDTMSRFYHYML